MAKTRGGLTKWFKQDWVDIGAPKKGGGFAKCGRTKQKKDAKRKYPKCVPRAKANAMTKSQIKSAAVILFLGFATLASAFCFPEYLLNGITLPLALKSLTYHSSSHAC